MLGHTPRYVRLWPMAPKPVFRPLVAGHDRLRVRSHKRLEKLKLEAFEPIDAKVGRSSSSYWSFFFFFLFWTSNTLGGAVFCRVWIATSQFTLAVEIRGGMRNDLLGRRKFAWWFIIFLVSCCWRRMTFLALSTYGPRTTTMSHTPALKKLCGHIMFLFEHSQYE